jgi:poly(A) polymerase
VLVHWSGDEVNSICRTLTCSNDHRKRVVWLVEHRGDLLDPTSLGLADLKLLMQHRGFRDLLALTRAWRLANGESLDAHTEIVKRVRAIPADEIAPAPLVDGEDLIELGLVPGPTFKLILDQVYRAQLEGKVTAKDEAVTLARAYSAGASESR